MHGRLDSDADLPVDQFAQRDRLKLMTTTGDTTYPSLSPSTP